MFQASADLTGSLISSNNLIAVYSGNVRDNIGGKSRDHMVDQILPATDLGHSFIVLPYSIRQSAGTHIDIISMFACTLCIITMQVSCAYENY